MSAHTNDNISVVKFVARLQEEPFGTLNGSTQPDIHTEHYDQPKHDKILKQQAKASLTLVRNYLREDPAAREVQHFLQETGQVLGLTYLFRTQPTFFQKLSKAISTMTSGSLREELGLHSYSSSTALRQLILTGEGLAVRRIYHANSAINVGETELSKLHLEDDSRFRDFVALLIPENNFRARDFRGASYPKKLSTRNTFCIEDVRFNVQHALEHMKLWLL